MSLRVPSIQSAAIISDDAQLAAQLSCLIAARGSYVTVLDAPRMGRSDHSIEVTRRKNAVTRSQAETVLIGGLTNDAMTALLEEFPPNFCRTIKSWEDAQDLVVKPKRLELPPLIWGRDRIGIGMLKALRMGRCIEFTDTQSPIDFVPASNHLVVCEVGEPLSEVIAANYAFSLGAGLSLIPTVPSALADEIMEGFYGLHDTLDFSPTESLAALTEKLTELCPDIIAPPHGSITFVSRKLPFGICFPQVPTTHLFTYPDLGISIVNGFSTEQPSSTGAEIAVLVDPGTTPAPEIQASAKVLAERRVFVREYRGAGASVRSVTEAVELFPYDLIIFATHCGDAGGFRWTYEYEDYEGVQRTLEVDIALGVGQTDDDDILDVVEYNRFHSLDGVSWSDPHRGDKLKVGSAIQYFSDMKKKNTFEPVKKESIERVTGSAAMKMFDDNYLATPRSLGNNATPIIINNACVSWHELAKRFTFADCRAYIGTLYPVVPAEADAVIMATIGKQFQKQLPHALWSAQNSVYKNSTRRPYVVTGVYTQYFRFGSDNAPKRILNEMIEAKRSWESRLSTLKAEGGPDWLLNKNSSIIEYYSTQIASFTRRWASKATDS